VVKYEKFKEIPADQKERLLVLIPNNFTNVAGNVWRVKTRVICKDGVKGYYGCTKKTCKAEATVTTSVNGNGTAYLMVSIHFYLLIFYF